MREKIASGFGLHSSEGWYLITFPYPMDGQNKLANNDWYVFKTEPRADVVQKKSTAFAEIGLSHNLSLLIRNCLIFFSIDEAHFTGGQRTLWGVLL